MCTINEMLIKEGAKTKLNVFIVRSLIFGYF